MSRSNVVIIRVRGNLSDAEKSAFLRLLHTASQYLYDNKIEMPVSVEFNTEELNSIYYAQNNCTRDDDAEA